MIASAMRGMSAATGGKQLDIETVETICHKTFDVIDAVVKDRTITSHEWALFCRNDLAMQRVLAKFSLAGKLQVSRSEAKDGGDSSPEASPRRRVDSGQVARRKSTLVLLLRRRRLCFVMVCEEVRVVSVVRVLFLFWVAVRLRLLWYGELGMCPRPRLPRHRRGGPERHRDLQRAARSNINGFTLTSTTWCYPAAAGGL